MGPEHVGFAALTIRMEPQTSFRSFQRLPYGFARVTLPGASPSVRLLFGLL